MKTVKASGEARLKLRAKNTRAEVTATIELSEPPHVWGTISPLTAESDGIISEWFDFHELLDEITVYAGGQGIFQLFKCTLVRRRLTSSAPGSLHEYDFMGSGRWKHRGTWKRSF